MQLNEQVENAYNALIEHVKQTPVLLLHPNSRYRSLLVAMLINDPNIVTYYYALGIDDIDLRAFVESIAHEMINQFPTFGRHLNMLADVDYNEQLDAVIEAFVCELQELSDDTFLFILDEYDRSDDTDDIHVFIEKLADHLPENCHLVLNGRTLPRLPWVSMVSKQRAILLQDDHLIETNFYDNSNNREYDLEVYALGPSIVRFRGEQVDSWEGHLPRLLFFFALDKPVVTRSEICSAFWPDLEMDQAVNVFHVTKRRLHKALGIDVLIHQDSHYQVNPELNVYYDVLDFVEALMRGRNANTEQPFNAWKYAKDLYRGPFLQGHNDAWILDRRAAYRTGYLEALTNMAQAWIERDRKEQALKLYRQALDEDYHQESIHRQIMELYRDLGRHSEAVAHFQALESSFSDEGVTVSPETAAIYDRLVN